jgi:hypothetical protein
MNLHFLTATANKNGSDGVFRRTRIMLSMSGRFLPPQAEDEDDEAAETEQDADDDAVCRSIRPTMTGRAHRRPRRSPNRQAAARGRKDREEAAREDETARHTGRERGRQRGYLLRFYAQASPQLRLRDVYKNRPKPGKAIAISFIRSLKIGRLELILKFF